MVTLYPNKLRVGDVLCVWGGGQRRTWEGFREVLVGFVKGATVGRRLCLKNAPLYFIVTHLFNKSFVLLHRLMFSSV